MLSRIRQRSRGLPTSLKSLNRSLQLLGSLNDLGWKQTIAAGRCVDAIGEPQPWFTLSATRWLEPRLRPGDHVFEYGAGGSTLWFGSRVESVVAVESDPNWAGYVRDHSGSGVTIVEESSGDSYISAPRGTRFDIVVIDGAEPRGPCAQVAAEVVANHGIVIWDNSDRPAYRVALTSLHRAGFGRLDFFGFALGLGTPACTSVFCRDWDRWVNVDAELPWFGT